jgi:hypothetical protein
VNVELEDLDTKHLVSCIAKPNPPDKPSTLCSVVESTCQLVS